MLIRDNATTAQAVVESLGINHFQAETLPEHKANFVKKLQSESEIVAMLGDGINDSIALAQMDVSIAMGKGSVIAMDVAKVILISSDLQKIPVELDRPDKRLARFVKICSGRFFII